MQTNKPPSTHRSTPYEFGTTSNPVSSSIVNWLICQSCNGRGVHQILQGTFLVPVICADCRGAGGFSPYVIGSIRLP